MIQPKDVPLEEPLKIRYVSGDPMQSEKLSHQADIRPARKLHPFEPIGRAEFGRKYFSERLHTGPARVNERPVDIE
jgi:hypothetical protein